MGGGSDLSVCSWRGKFRHGFKKSSDVYVLALALYAKNSMLHYISLVWFGFQNLEDF